MIYKVVLKSALPPDLARKIAEAHAEALKRVQARQSSKVPKKPTTGSSI